MEADNKFVRFQKQIIFAATSICEGGEIGRRATLRW